MTTDFVVPTKLNHRNTKITCTLTSKIKLVSGFDFDLLK